MSEKKYKKREIKDFFLCFFFNNVYIINLDVFICIYIGIKYEWRVIIILIFKSNVFFF